MGNKLSSKRKLLQDICRLPAIVSEYDENSAQSGFELLIELNRSFKPFRNFRDYEAACDASFIEGREVNHPNFCLVFAN